MAAKKAPAKKIKEDKKVTQIGSVNKVSRQDANTARSNASKRGTLMGPTYVRAGGNKGAVTESTTDIKSKRGNYYQITETKKRVALGKDPKTKTSIGQITNYPVSKKNK
jgi:hypothetical protein